MKSSNEDQVIGSPVNVAKCMFERSLAGYLAGPDNENGNIKSCPANGSNAGRAESMLKRMNKIGKKADTLANGLREHVRLAPKITEIVKGKLSLGAKILQVGGVEKIFKRLFTVNEDELLKASQCYLSTTAGPIAGLSFISAEKVAFCSERSIKFSSANGNSIRVHYKVLIPLNKIKRVNPSENANKPSQKYMEIVTVDDFDFWFMGFLNYEKAFKYLQQTINLM